MSEAHEHGFGATAGSGYGMQRRLAAREARDLPARETRHREARFGRRRPEVREKNDVGESQQFGVDRRLELINVEARAEKMLRMKGRDERLLVHDRTARGVHEDRASRQQSELRGAKPAAGRVREGRVNGQHIYFQKEFPEFLFGSFLVEGDDFHPESLSP